MQRIHDIFAHIWCEKWRSKRVHIYRVYQGRSSHISVYGRSPPIECIIQCTILHVPVSTGGVHIQSVSFSVSSSTYQCQREEYTSRVYHIVYPPPHASVKGRSTHIECIIQCIVNGRRRTDSESSKSKMSRFSSKRSGVLVLTIGTWVYFFCVLCFECTL